MWEIISGVLGIIGFIFSVVNFVYFFATKKKKLVICFERYGIKPHLGNNVIALVQYRLDNLSQEPITITQVRLIINDNKYNCFHIPYPAIQSKITRGETVRFDYTCSTDVMPINLGSRVSQGGYPGFQVPEDTLSENETRLTFEICTNRGKPFQKTFVLNEDSLCR